MKKILFIILVLFLVGCEFESYQDKNKTTPMGCMGRIGEHNEIIIIGMVKNFDGLIYNETNSNKGCCTYKLLYGGVCSTNYKLIS